MIFRKLIGLVEGEASAAEVVAAYHERTKHHFHRYAASFGYLDWAAQPDPFRRYAGADLDEIPALGSDIGKLFVARSLEGTRQGEWLPPFLWLDS